MTPTWFEHATFWSGVRRATVAPRSPCLCCGDNTGIHMEYRFQAVILNCFILQLFDITRPYKMPYSLPIYCINFNKISILWLEWLYVFQISFYAVFVWNIHDSYIHNKAVVQQGTMCSVVTSVHQVSPEIWLYLGPKKNPKALRKSNICQYKVNTRSRRVEIYYIVFIII